jgi:hypothetical protein
LLENENIYREALGEWKRYRKYFFIQMTLQIIISRVSSVSKERKKTIGRAVGLETSNRTMYTPDENIITIFLHGF